MIHAIKQYDWRGRQIDLGVYVNADDIATSLRTGGLDLKEYRAPHLSKESFLMSASRSGMIRRDLTLDAVSAAVDIRDGVVRVHDKALAEEVAQLASEALRQSLLATRTKFSFETVFSHPSKVAFMRDSAAAGYKNYFYFVGTSSPAINTFRVQSRVRLGGHGVPEHKIAERYFRTMDLMWEGAQLAHQAFFFDNSSDGSDLLLFAHFQLVDGRKHWQVPDLEKVPDWFKKFYIGKVKRQQALP